MGILPTLENIFSGLGNMLRWWIVIAPWEQAIRVRGGKSIKTLGPGIRFRIPGLDRFFIQSTRKRYMHTPPQNVTTKDGRSITISGGTAYIIKDIGMLYDTLNAAEDVIATETQSKIAEYVTERTLEECSIGGLQSYVNEHLNLTKYGLGDVGFFVTDFVAVRTYRIITGGPRDYAYGDSLNTTAFLQ